MKRRIARILSAAGRTTLPKRPHLGEKERDDVLQELEVFLVEQVRAMPDYLLTPYVIALFVFELSPMLRYGRSFSALADAERAAIVSRWSASPIGPMRDLLKLIRSCALFFYLDHPVVKKRMEVEAGRRSADEGRDLADRP